MPALGTAPALGTPPALGVGSVPAPAPASSSGARRRRPSRTPSVRLVALVVAALVAVGGCGDDGSAGPDRQAEVAERGASVMPFDLDATVHRFEPRDDGLVQTVVAHDVDDDEQVRLVRRHLDDEAERFAAGDFDDPASIHGHDMPGLADLAAGADRIEVSYAEVAGGAQITYSTGDAGLVDALHAWGDAQVSDHGDHAEHVGDEHAADGAAAAPAPAPAPAPRQVAFR